MNGKGTPPLPTAVIGAGGPEQVCRRIAVRFAAADPAATVADPAAAALLWIAGADAAGEAADAARRGAALLAEPEAWRPDAETVRRLDRLAAAAGGWLSAAFRHRFHPDVLMLGELFSAGRFGAGTRWMLRGAGVAAADLGLLLAGRPERIVPQSGGREALWEYAGGGCLEWRAEGDLSLDWTGEAGSWSWTPAGFRQWHCRFACPGGTGGRRPDAEMLRERCWEDAVDACCCGRAPAVPAACWAAALDGWRQSGFADLAAPPLAGSAGRQYIAAVK